MFSVRLPAFDGPAVANPGGDSWGLDMPRQRRADEAGTIYHVWNRGHGRQTLSHKPDDYEAFLRVLGEGLARYPVSLFSFTLTPNHWA